MKWRKGKQKVTLDEGGRTAHESSEADSLQKYDKDAKQKPIKVYCVFLISSIFMKTAWFLIRRVQTKNANLASFATKRVLKSKKVAATLRFNSAQAKMRKPARYCLN